MGGLPTRARREGSSDRIGRSAGPEADQGASVNDDHFDPLKIVQAFNHRGSMQFAGVPSDDDVLDAAVVKCLDDLERVEVIVVHTGTLVVFRARKAADTAARSFATRARW